MRIFKSNILYLWRIKKIKRYGEMSRKIKEIDKKGRE